jgi:4-diphosphocytidyl-2-C-methyl-D-erythritol kinase
MIQKLSPCKINLLLNTLGKGKDGFHELETVIMPVALHDELSYEPKTKGGIELTIEGSALSAGPDNLIVRAAAEFFSKSMTSEHIAIHLKKNIPLEAGLGGGSANAAVTLTTLNEISSNPLPYEDLKTIAASLGSDVPFFLQDKPALGEGRGEQVISLPAFKSLKGKALFLVKPGFGVSTPWAYNSLQRFPDLLNGRPGRGKELATALDENDLSQASTLFFNSLEGPVLEKFPILRLFQTKLKALGAEVTLMSGSGSTTFAIFPDLPSADNAIEGFRQDFGATHWIHTTELNA